MVMLMVVVMVMTGILQVGHEITLDIEPKKSQTLSSFYNIQFS